MESTFLLLTFDSFVLGIALGVLAAFFPYIVHYRLLLGMAVSYFFQANPLIVLTTVLSLSEWYFPVLKLQARGAAAILRKIYPSKDLEIDLEILDRIKQELQQPDLSLKQRLIFPRNFFKTISSSDLSSLLHLSLIVFYCLFSVGVVIGSKLLRSQQDAWAFFVEAQNAIGGFTQSNLGILAAILGSILLVTGIFTMLVDANFKVRSSSQEVKDPLIRVVPSAITPLGMTIVLLGAVLLVYGAKFLPPGWGMPGRFLLVLGFMSGFLWFFVTLKTGALPKRRVGVFPEWAQKLVQVVFGIFAVMALVQWSSGGMDPELFWLLPRWAMKMGLGMAVIWLLVILRDQTVEDEMDWLGFAYLFLFFFFLIYFKAGVDLRTGEVASPTGILLAALAFALLAVFHLVAALTRQRIELQILAKKSLQSQFISMMLHEIGNPIGLMRSTIAFFDRHLNEGTLADTLTKRRARVERQLRRGLEASEELSQILEEIRNYHKPFVEHFEYLSLEALLKESWQKIDDLPKRHIQFRYDLSDLTKTQLRLDKTAMVFIFRNLLRNAIQAQPPTAEKGRGSIIVWARFVPFTSTGSEGAFYLTISDEGHGIKGSLSRIFEPYVTSKAQGTGLGLPLVRKMVEEVYKGSIRVESRPRREPRVGTRFLIQFNTKRELPEKKLEG